MTEQATNFLGIPIEGQIYKTHAQSTPQITKEEFAAKLRLVIEDPRVTAVRWRQYTPYFNDGDPCVFSVGEVTFKFDIPGVTIEDDMGDYEDGFITSFDMGYWDELSDYFGKSHRDWNNKNGELVWDKEPQDRPFREAINDLSSTLEGGSANDVVLGAFGDHAVVTVFKDKIQVDEYEHD